MLKTIKIIHTLIWMIMAAATFYILYAGITNKFDNILFVSIWVVSFETIILVVNKWTCPLTPWAAKHTQDRNHNFDIYLPNLLAKYNKSIFGTLFVIWIILVIINCIKK